MEKKRGCQALPDLQERWNEFSRAYDDLESVNNVFYDFHAMAAATMAGQEEKCKHFTNSVREQASLFGENKSFNCWVAKSVGVDLFDALLALKNGAHEKVVDLLKPIR